MSFKLEQENQNKSIKIDTISQPIDDIKFSSKREFDQFKYKEPSEDENDAEDDNLGLNLLANQDKKVEEEISEVSEYESDTGFNNDDASNSSPSDDVFMREHISSGYHNNEDPHLSSEEIQHQKAYYLSQLKRLEKKGHYPSRRLGSEHSLSEIKGEVLKIRKEIEIDRGVNYCRQGLMFCVSTIEMLNNKYDPFDVDLDGWSNVIMADKENYDDVFEELYEKYNSKISMSPEIKLISMVAGSAMMFHLQKTLINKHLSGSGGGGGLLGSLGNLASKFTGGGNEASPSSPSKPQKMKGPSVDTDELLRKLNTDDFSDISSVTSEARSEASEKVITVPQPKKRGRPRKKN